VLGSGTNISGSTTFGIRRDGHSSTSVNSLARDRFAIALSAPGVKITAAMTLDPDVFAFKLRQIRFRKYAFRDAIIPPNSR
jgi:hypothetical protein